MSEREHFSLWNLAGRGSPKRDEGFVRTQSADRGRSFVRSQLVRTQANDGSRRRCNEVSVNYMKRYFICMHEKGAVDKMDRVGYFGFLVAQLKMLGLRECHCIAFHVYAIFAMVLSGLQMK